MTAERLLHEQPIVLAMAVFLFGARHRHTFQFSGARQRVN